MHLAARIHRKERKKKKTFAGKQKHVPRPSAKKKRPLPKVCDKIGEYSKRPVRGGKRGGKKKRETYVVGEPIAKA